MASPNGYLSNNEEIGDLPVRIISIHSGVLYLTQGRKNHRPRGRFLAVEDLLPQGIRLQLPADHLST